jgi:hypothetical protein
VPNVSAFFFVTAITLFCAFSPTAAYAVAMKNSSKFHFRSGPVFGHYTGQFKGDFTAPVGFDMEYEVLYRPARSYFLRFTTAMDNPESRPFYTYAGGGHRWYMNSKGRSVQYDDGSLEISSLPRWRYYVGADLGTAQIIVKTFGEVFQVVANLVEIGTHAGIGYAFSQNFGAEIQAGATFGYGYSSVPANGRTVRGFFGLNYSF